MVEKMTDICNVNLPAVSPDRRELAIGIGASIVVAVATSIVLLLTLLVATFAAPAHAATAATAGGESSGAIAGIVIIAVLAGWLRATADLWRAVFNRVRTWNLFRI
jgi:hypothetical protein